MATRTWLGGTGDWTDPAQWASGVPTPGDDASVFAGNANFLANEGPVSGIFDVFGLFVGSGDPNAPAQITSNGATFGNNVTIESANVLNTQAATTSYGQFTSVGSTAFGGTMDLIGGPFQITTEASAGTPGGDFIIQHSGTITISEMTFYLVGRIDVEGDFGVGVQSTLDNTGLINVESNSDIAFSEGQTSFITGGGTIAVGLGGVADFAGTVSNQTISFTQPGTYKGGGGVVKIDASSTFNGSITGFAAGDIIDLGVTATSASFDVTTGTLSVFNGSSEVAALSVTGPSSSTSLTVTSDGAGGVILELPNSPALSTETRVAGDIAMGSDVARATLTTHAGAAISGAGVRIGVISDSFNFTGGVNADAAAGYLPANPDGTSSVTVLQDGTNAGSEDEGRAMAELVHQVAPGAQIYFYTDQGSETSMANGIAQMVADGVKIIVDDVKLPDEPYFQVAGPVDTAILNAINAGVSYFSSATNYGNSYYQASFSKSPTTLNNVPGQVYAQTFSDGTTYQSINLTGSKTTIVLGWDAPFPTTLAGTSPLAMEMVLYDMNGNVVGTSQQLTTANGSPYASEPETEIASVPAGTYSLAIYQTAAEAAAVQVSLFKYELVGQPPGAIADPAASNGSGDIAGHDLVPGVNAVAASTFMNAPAFTGDKTLESFSANGPGELLFAPDGTRLATPVADGKPNFTAPDGINASSDLASGFRPFYGTSAAAPDAAGLAALLLQANPNLAQPGGPAQVTSILEQTALNLGLPASHQGAGLVQAVPAVTMALSLACYATGTHLLTAKSEVRVENLRVGDSMVTHGGACRLVVWIGRRQVECRYLPDPVDAWPIRVRRGAFGAGRPHRDLLLSPDHAILEADSGLLIPIRCFVNGTTIAPCPVARVTYWHVELATHDVLLAEGLPAESYLDTGNRAVFANAPPLPIMSSLPVMSPVLAKSQVWADGAGPGRWRRCDFPRPASRISVPGAC